MEGRCLIVKMLGEVWLTDCLQGLELNTVISLCCLINNVSRRCISFIELLILVATSEEAFL